LRSTAVAPGPRCVVGALDALGLEGPVVDPLGPPGALQGCVAQLGPTRAPAIDLAAPALAVVQLARLRAEAVRLQAPRRHQQVRMVVALISLLARRVDRRLSPPWSWSCGGWL